jgi:hypothetical protein
MKEDIKNSKGFENNGVLFEALTDELTNIFKGLLK